MAVMSFFRRLLPTLAIIGMLLQLWHVPDVVALNRRVQQMTDGGTTQTTTNYVIDTSGGHTGYAQVLEEMDGSGNATKTYTIGHDVLAQQAAAVAAGAVLRFLYDGHGSTRALVSGTAASAGILNDTAGGNGLQLFTYDAYGNLAPGSFTGTALTRLLYSGELTDLPGATGLQYLRARYYDPTTGRFTWSDPANLSSPIRLHKYLYANGNPVMMTDPAGLLATGTMQLSLVTSITVYVALVAAIAKPIVAARQQAKLTALAVQLNATLVKSPTQLPQAHQDRFFHGSSVGRWVGAVILPTMGTGDQDFGQGFYTFRDNGIYSAPNSKQRTPFEAAVGRAQYSARVYGNLPFVLVAHMERSYYQSLRRINLGLPPNYVRWQQVVIDSRQGTDVLGAEGWDVAVGPSATGLFAKSVSIDHTLPYQYAFKTLRATAGFVGNPIYIIPLPPV